jgi:hypothetical protein
MQRVGGVVTVEHDLAATEAPTPRDREESLHLVRRDVREQPPFHATDLPPARSG